MNYLILKITYCGAMYVAGELNWIGYQLKVPKNYEIEENKFAKFYVYEHYFVNQSKNTISKELYGFRSFNERQLFVDLININSIGPKTALTLLKNDVEKVIEWIAEGNVDVLANIKGISEKAANLICDHLKSKYINKITEKNPWVKDMVIGLENLGYNKKEIDYAISKVKVEDDYDISEVIKIAIKEIGSINNVVAN